MKSAAKAYNSLHAEHTQPDNRANNRSSRIHYILVAALLALMYLILRWLPTAPANLSFDLWSGFVFFWLFGGLVTLGMLALSAKR